MTISCGSGDAAILEKTLGTVEKERAGFVLCLFVCFFVFVCCVSCFCGVFFCLRI